MVKPDKSRYVWRYLPSSADKDRGQALADKAQTPLSNFCISIIEERLAEEEDFKSRREMACELEALRAETKTLRDDIRQKSIVIDRYEAELRRYRSQAFLDESFKGIRHYSKELVDLLKARGHVDSYRLLEALWIDPRDADLVKAVSRQLEELEGFGMVKAEAGGSLFTALL